MVARISQGVLVVAGWLLTVFRTPLTMVSTTGSCEYDLIMGTNMSSEIGAPVGPPWMMGFLPSFPWRATHSRSSFPNPSLSFWGAILRPSKSSSSLIFMTRPRSVL